MRTLVISIALVAASAAPAFAWDGPGMWYRDADDANPGGGGILGTGGAHDHGIKCADCHVDRAMEVIALDWQFTPPMAPAGPDLIFAPGQRYRVDVRMTGAQLGSPCTDGVNNIDGFAAAFETETGAVAGALESDSGQSRTSCPPVFPSPPPAGTTGLAGDCAVVFGMGENRTQWTFYWTAPASGTVKLSFGGVDGDCGMMSMEDATVDGGKVLRSEALAERPASPTRVLAAPAGFAGRGAPAVAITVTILLGLVAVPATRRRRRRH